MPTISMFYGIVIRMYYFDDRQHHTPHVHAEYSGQKGVFDVSDGAILAGVLPLGKARLVQAWIEIHREELLANWSLTVNGEEVFKIEPLKQECSMNPHVNSIRPLDDYCLEILFENGERRVFDVKPYLYRGVFVRLQNHALFEAARVVAGSVEWPGGLDLSYDTLYLESQPTAKPAAVELTHV